MATLLPNDKKIPNTPSPPLTGTIGVPAVNKAPAGGAAKAIAKPPATGTIGVPASLRTTKTQAPAASPFDQFGGRDAYIKSQTERYNQANGDQGLMSKLQADAKRVGYTLPAAQNGGVPIGYEWLGAGFENEVDSQLAGFNQQQEAARLAADYQIGQNNQYLQDQIAAMQQQRAVDQDSLQQQQNRFGGLYSGGLNYQGGQINSAYASQQGQLSRDISGRNAQLLAQYGSQANSLAQQISQLQASRPEIINEKIRTYMDQQAGLYGANPLTGQKTAAYEGQQFGQDLSTKQYERGVIESDRGYNRGVLESDRAFKYTQGRDQVEDAIWQSEFDRIKEQDGIQNAIAWANQSLNQAEFDDNSAYRWAGLDAELAAAANEGEKYQGMSANDVVSNVRKNFDDGDGALLTDNASREQMYMQIVGAGLPTSQEDQALAAIGFTPAEIKRLDDKYLTSGK